MTDANPPRPGAADGIDPRDVLLLFDVDGTLVRGTRTHEDAILEALRETFLVPPGRREPLIHGQTDVEIAVVRMKNAGFEAAEIWSRVEEYARRTSELFASRVRPSEIVVLDGVPEALSSVRSAGYSIGLLTGNVQAVAWKVSDVRAARRAESEVIALTTGLTSEAELRAEGAQTVLSSMRELPSFLESWRDAGRPPLQPR